MRTDSFVLFACSSLFIAEFVSFVSCVDDTLTFEDFIKTGIDRVLITNNMTEESSSLIPWITNTTNRKLVMHLMETRGYIVMKTIDPIIVCNRGVSVTDVQSRRDGNAITFTINLDVPELAIKTDTLQLNGYWNEVNLGETVKFSMTYHNIFVALEIKVSQMERNGGYYWQLDTTKLNESSFTSTKKIYDLESLKIFPGDVTAESIDIQMEFLMIPIIDDYIFVFVRKILNSLWWQETLFDHFQFDS